MRSTVELGKLMSDFCKVILTVGCRLSNVIVEQNGAPWGISRVSKSRSRATTHLRFSIVALQTAAAATQRIYTCLILVSEQHTMNSRAGPLSFKVLSLVCRART
jgi:hypothetical protein